MAAGGARAVAFDARSLQLRSPLLVDLYHFDPMSATENATSVLHAFGALEFVVAVLGHRLAVEQWLPEVRSQASEVKERPVERASIAEQITEVQRVTGLRDGQLAAAFPRPVSRETVNRWRNRDETHMKAENAYRLGLLVQLARAMESAGIDAPQWLRQPVEGGTETPYELICSGRLSDVRQAVEMARVGAVAPWAPMSTVKVSRESDVTFDEEGDDASTWAWSELEEDN